MSVFVDNQPLIREALAGRLGLLFVGGSQHGQTRAVQGSSVRFPTYDREKMVAVPVEKIDDSPIRFEYEEYRMMYSLDKNDQVTSVWMAVSARIGRL